MGDPHDLPRLSLREDWRKVVASSLRTSGPLDEPFSRAFTAGFAYRAAQEWVGNRHIARQRPRRIVNS